MSAPEPRLILRPAQHERSVLLDPWAVADEIASLMRAEAAAGRAGEVKAREAFETRRRGLQADMAFEFGRRQGWRWRPAPACRSSELRDHPSCYALPGQGARVVAAAWHTYMSRCRIAGMADAEIGAGRWWLPDSFPSWHCPGRTTLIVGWIAPPASFFVETPDDEDARRLADRARRDPWSVGWLLREANRMFRRRLARRLASILADEFARRRGWWRTGSAAGFQFRGKRRAAYARPLRPRLGDVDLFRWAEPPHLPAAAVVQSADDPAELLARGQELTAGGWSLVRDFPSWAIGSRFGHDAGARPLVVFVSGTHDDR